MDGRRFDALTRALAQTASRRRTVGAIAIAAVGALWGGRATAVSAQSTRCGESRLRQPCGECGVCLRLSEFGPVRCVPLAYRCSGRTDDDACPACDPATLTCRPARPCGPCGRCLGAMGTGCEYFPQGRNGQCDPNINPCNPDTGQCYCRRGLTFCEPDCTDLQTDPNHCGQCHYPCRHCEHCRKGQCVPCDETCERCDEQRGCVSTCEDQCKACLDGQCVKPDPPICICGTEDEGAPPAAKRVSLPVVAAAGADASEVEPCGEGDKAQCCVPEACCGEGVDARCCSSGNTCLMGASERRPICCPPEFVCGDVCCGGGEECTSPGCCCSALNISLQGGCFQCQ